MFKMQISAQTDIGSRPYPFKFFKGCLPQIFLGPFLNTLSHTAISKKDVGIYKIFFKKTKTVH